MALVRTKRTPRYALEGSASIDWSRDISKGLTCYVHLAGNSGGRDLVTGTELLAQNSAVVTSTNRGRMINCIGANQGLQATASLNHYTFPSTAGSILWAGNCPSISPISTFTRLGGLSYDSTTVPPFDVLTIELDNFFGNWYPIVAWNDGTLRSIGNTTIPLNEDSNYCQAVGTVTPTFQQIFVNGRAAGSGTLLSASFAHGTSPQLICCTYPGQTFNSGCNFQNLMLWNRELTTSEVQDLYYYGPGLVLKNERKYWLFGGSGGAAVALSGSIFSDSQINCNLRANRALSAKVYSDSQINVPVLYKSLTFPSVSLLSESQLRANIGRIQSLAAKVEAASEISNTISNIVPLSVKIYSASSVEASLARLLVGSIYSFGIEIIPHSPTSYLKGAPRPIAYLKSDDDITGITNETIQSSPDDYQFL